MSRQGLRTDHRGLVREVLVEMEVLKMEEFVVTRELVLMLMPLILVQVGMFIYCARRIYREGVENLNRWIWILICLFVNLIGPIAFLILGRKREYR